MYGSKYARFSHFLYSPQHVIDYLKDIKNKKARRYIGHNPAGGWMIIVLLLNLSLITVSGLKVYAIEEGLGPLAQQLPTVVLINNSYADDDDHDDNKSHGSDHDQEEFWEEIHEWSSNVMLLLILLHIIGVFTASKLHNENLVKAMITGKKQPHNRDMS